MSDRRTLKPAEGCAVYDPLTNELLPAEGKVVEVESYWLRRLGDGDVLDISPPADSAEADVKPAVAGPVKTPEVK